MAIQERITFEMLLKEYEENVPTRLLRMMWTYAMDMLNQLQAHIDEFELNSCNCHNVSTRTNGSEC